MALDGTDLGCRLGVATRSGAREVAVYSEPVTNSLKKKNSPSAMNA
jgi:hypothetical protein